MKEFVALEGAGDFAAEVGSKATTPSLSIYVVSQTFAQLGPHWRVAQTDQVDRGCRRATEARRCACRVRRPGHLCRRGVASGDLHRRHGRGQDG